MNRDNGFCLRHDGCLGGFWIHTIGLIIHIYNYRNCSSTHDSSSCCLKSVCRNEDFISPSNVHSPQGNFHGHSAICHWNGIASTLHLSKTLSELSGLRTRGRVPSPSTRFDDIGNSLDVTLVIYRPIWIRLRSDRRD